MKMNRTARLALGLALLPAIAVVSTVTADPPAAVAKTPAPRSTAPKAAAPAKSGAAVAERKAPANPGVPKVDAQSVSGPLVVGTQQFDNNTPFRRDGTDGGTVGNRFALVAPVHSIATVQFAAAGNFSTSVVMTVWDVNPASAMVLNRQLVTGIPQAPPAAGRYSAMLAAPIVGHTGQFIAGLRNSDYDPCAGNQALGSTCDGVALTQGAGAGGGPEFRAVRVPFNTGAFVPTINTVASTGNSIAGVNAIFRVTGDNLPVELMQFGAE